MRRDLEELVAEARSLGYYTNLITSAIGMDEPRVRRLREAGLDHIQISFQASDAALNDHFAGTDAFAHKVEMARAVKAHGYPMVLNVVIHRHNIDRTDAILDMALDLGADYVELANTQYYGWAYHNRHRLLPSREQLERSEAIANRYKETHGDRMRILYVIPDYYASRPKPCMNGWGRVFLSIAPDGTALPCQGARMLPGLEFPKVTEHPVAWIWNESPAFNRFRGTEWMKEPCRSCPERDKDFGGCRCQGLARRRRPGCGGSGVRPVAGSRTRRPRGGSRQRPDGREERHGRRDPRDAVPQPSQTPGPCTPERQATGPGIHGIQSARFPVGIVAEATPSRVGGATYGSACRAHPSRFIPSQATSQPRSLTARLSSLSSSSTGLVVLMWMKTLRRTPSGANAAIVPSSPEMLMWPIRRPVFTPTPERIISSSVQSVPSKSTSSAPARRAARASVIRAQAGT